MCGSNQRKEAVTDDFVFKPTNHMKYKVMLQEIARDRDEKVILLKKNTNFSVEHLCYT